MKSQTARICNARCRISGMFTQSPLKILILLLVSFEKNQRMSENLSKLYIHPQNTTRMLCEEHNINMIKENRSNSE